MNGEGSSNDGIQPPVTDMKISEVAETAPENFATLFKQWTQSITQDQDTSYYWGDEDELETPITYKSLHWSFRDGRKISICSNDSPRWGADAYIALQDSKENEVFNVNLTPEGKLVDDDDDDVPPTMYSEIYSLMSEVSREKETADYSNPASFSEIEEISDPERQSEIMSRLTSSDSQPDAKKLIDRLTKKGLEPKFGMKIADGSTCFFSKMFYEKGDRPVVIGYIDNDGKVTPRSYYLSGSHGTWRFLPGWSKHPDDIESKWYVKTDPEEQLNVPIPMQKALADIASHSPATSVADAPLDDDIIFDIAGEVKGSYPGDLMEFHGIKKIKAPDAIREGLVGTKPEEIDFPSTDDPQHPNFSKSIDKWIMSSSIYGRVEVEVYPSNNSELNFMFCRDAEGRTWIAGVDVAQSPIKKTGLRSTVFGSGLLTMPVFEYLKAFTAKDYGAQQITEHYADMWPVFHSKLPVIQRYIAHKKLEE